MTKTIRTIIGKAFWPGKIALANRLGFLLGTIVLSSTWRGRALSALEPFCHLEVIKKLPLAKRNQTVYDVVIVGAGPAGNLLAYELARAGWSVLLLEKKQLPCYKACGGGLTQRALKLIPFDVQDIVED